MGSLCIEMESKTFFRPNLKRFWWKLVCCFRFLGTYNSGNIFWNFFLSAGGSNDLRFILTLAFYILSQDVNAWLWIEWRSFDPEMSPGGSSTIIFVSFFFVRKPYPEFSFWPENLHLQFFSLTSLNNAICEEFWNAFPIEWWLLECKQSLETNIYK